MKEKIESLSQEDLTNEINKMSKLSKQRDLSDEEVQYRKLLREKFINDFKTGYRKQLDSIKVVNEKGEDVTPCKKPQK